MSRECRRLPQAQPLVHRLLERDELPLSSRELVLQFHHSYPECLDPRTETLLRLQHQVQLSPFVYAQPLVDEQGAQLALDRGQRAWSEITRVTRADAAGFFVFSPGFDASERCTEDQESNPTRDCMHVVYTDAELGEEAAGAGWRTRPIRSSAEGLRLIAGTRQGG